MAYDITSNPNYQAIINQLMQSLPGATSKNVSDYTQQTGQDTNQFMNQFQNYVGRAANPDEINRFATDWILPNTDQLRTPGSQIQSNVPNAINQFIGQNFQQQANQQAQQQGQDALQGNLKQVQDVVNKQTQATASDLLNPNSPTFQQFSGLMNNMGITPSSGAFQSGLGSTIGSAAAGNEAAALGQFAIPAIGGQQGLATANYGNNLMNLYPQMSQYNKQSYDLQDFGLQRQLAERLAGEAAPNGFEKGLGYANASSNILKNFAEFGPSNAGTSYVCKELIKRGLICESDMDDFHVHIMPAMLKKGRAFWKYAMDGERLVTAVNRLENAELAWKTMKPFLFDSVMAEKDPCKAVDEYADACAHLCMITDPDLWDKRVFRTGFWDSLQFLPRLFLYKPFQEALWKCIRIKTLFLYDKPRCEVPHGAR